MTNLQIASSSADYISLISYTFEYWLALIAIIGIGNWLIVNTPVDSLIATINEWKYLFANRLISQITEDYYDHFNKENDKYISQSILIILFELLIKNHERDFVDEVMRLKNLYFRSFRDIKGTVSILNTLEEMSITSDYPKLSNFRNRQKIMDRIQFGIVITFLINMVVVIYELMDPNKSSQVVSFFIHYMVVIFIVLFFVIIIVYGIYILSLRELYSHKRKIRKLIEALRELDLPNDTYMKVVKIV